MKTIIFSIFAITFLVSCVEAVVEPTTNLSDPNLAKVTGKWELYKISFGYPVPGGPTEKKPDAVEYLDFSATNKTVTKTVVGTKETTTEKSTFELKNYSAERNQLALFFVESKTYSFFTFDEATQSIILYERVPVGAILADGNSYHYKKVK
jgi:hypothetical protein